MTYHALAEFARSWGLVYLVALFAGSLAYALWPGNAAKFAKAAHRPLEEE